LCSDFTIPSSAFSKFPTTIDTSDIRYLFALFYWMSNIQDFNWGFWNYMERLKLFVNNGMTDDSFVDEFSDIVLDSSRDGPKRKANFKQILETLFSEEEVAPSPSEDSTSGVSVQLPMEPIADADIQSPGNTQGSDYTIAQTPDNPPPAENIQVTPSSPPVQLPTSPQLPSVSLEPDFPEFSNTGFSAEPPASKPTADVPPPPSLPFINNVFEYSRGSNYPYSLGPVVGICIYTFIAYILH
jgi:hypothetical protein